MKKSKRQKQIDLLEALLKRIKTNYKKGYAGDKFIATSQEVYDNNIRWVQEKIDEVAGGDVNLDSGGLTKDDMILANGMWTRHALPFRQG
jgi:hypothetical protein